MKFNKIKNPVYFLNIYIVILSKKTKMSDLIKKGIKFVPNFISIEAVNNINNELDRLFSTFSINGLSGFIRRGKNYKSIQLPLNMIRSENLLEISLNIHEIICKDPKLSRQNYKLTNLEIFEQKDAKRLFWHTDGRKGMLRSFIYLEGGDLDSGAFNYIEGTHLDEYPPNKHEFSNQEIELLKDKINIVVGEKGSMLIADTNGIHSNQPKIKRRRVIVFEFQPEKSTSVKSSISIPSNLLSKRVIENINFFSSNHDYSKFDHGLDITLFHKQFNIPLSILLNICLEHTLGRLLKKIVNR